MNSAIILITLLGIFSLTVTFIALRNAPLKKEDIHNQDKPVPLPQKSIKLFNASGKLLLEYTDCYVTHFSQTLYLLSHQYKGEAFLKIDKGSDMLLLIENHLEGETDATNEVK
ncbi:hypothetical protein [Sulfurimonas hydrogeniphila]|uniref:hypothetical protein n=1 Tax=Sulfurimonas hydrogeniphila TaxID=2509341 RepID=UPI00125EFAC3|nr:hypothetical protein [Sulfurimonas hydrogeniphila]